MSAPFVNNRHALGFYVNRLTRAERLAGRLHLARLIGKSALEELDRRRIDRQLVRLAHLNARSGRRRLLVGGRELANELKEVAT